jgi:vancomycin permeability regulator SanA
MRRVASGSVPHQTWSFAAVPELPSSFSRLLKPFRRGVWRYLSDLDVLQAGIVVLLLIACTGGLIWVGYFIHVWRIATGSQLTPPRRMTALVFGRRLVADAPEADYRQRLGRVLSLARSGSADRVMLLGGRSGGRVSEAAAGQAWLDVQGWPDGVPVQLEQASIDSLENLRHARSLLMEGSVGATRLPPVALITSRYHLARCLMLARRLGFDGIPIAAEAELPRHWRYVVRLIVESGYLMWIDVGMRWAHLIGHRRMVARIS